MLCGCTYPLLRRAQRRADPAHFAVRGRAAPRTEFHAETAELLPLRVGKQPAGIGKRRQQSVIRAKHQQNTGAAVAEHGQRRKLDGIADGGNGTDRSILQQHGKQLHKQLRFKACRAQNLIHLLKRGNERLVELAAFLRALGLPGLFERILLRLKPSGSVERFQQCSDGAHLLVYRPCLCQCQPERAQRGHSLLPQLVQRLQRGLILRLHGLTKPARVQLPRLFPRGAANAPVIGIVLQRIAVRLAER